MPTLELQPRHLPVRGAFLLINLELQAPALIHGGLIRMKNGKSAKTLVDIRTGS